jgi:hypothetical protein
VPGPSGYVKVTGANGNVNLGGGGGGMDYAAGQTGSSGGSGVALFAHPTAYSVATTTGSNVSVNINFNGYVLYSFYASGTITF